MGIQCLCLVGVRWSWVILIQVVDLYNGLKCKHIQHDTCGRSSMLRNQRSITNDQSSLHRQSVMKSDYIVTKQPNLSFVSVIFSLIRKEILCVIIRQIRFDYVNKKIIVL